MMFDKKYLSKSVRHFSEMFERFHKFSTFFFKMCSTFFQNVFNTFSKCVQPFFSKCVRHFFKMCSTLFQNVFNTFSKCFRHFFSKCVRHFSKMFEYFSKCSNIYFLKLFDISWLPKSSFGICFYSFFIDMSSQRLSFVSIEGKNRRKKS
jgi:hypothetical protein